jgi:hypothetical protein
MMTSAERELREHPATVFCDYCKEPITYSEPGYNWMFRSADASMFPYNGAAFLVVLHDVTGCLKGWTDDQPDGVHGKVDSAIEVHP